MTTRAFFWIIFIVAFIHATIAIGQTPSVTRIYGTDCAGAEQGFVLSNCSNCSIVGWTISSNHTTPTYGSGNMTVTGFSWTTPGNKSVSVSYYQNGVPNVKSYGVTISQPASVTLNDPGLLCVGKPVTLTTNATAAGSNPSYYFYINNVQKQSGSSSSFTTSELQNGDVVKVTLYPGSTCITPVSAEQTVSAQLVGPAATGPAIALTYGSTVQLSASGAATGEIYKWYDAQNNYFCTAPCNSAPATANTTYYVVRYNQNTQCETPYANKAALSIQVTVPKPLLPQYSTNTCGPVSLTFAQSPPGTIWVWQGTNPNGTSSSPVVSGTTLPDISTGTYYVRAKTTTSPTLWSEATEVNITADPVDLVLNSHNTATTLVQARHSITLGPGFHVAAGSSFTARIKVTDECNNLVNWTESIVYDQAGKPIATSRSYFDGLGRSLIDESKDHLTGKIWATQPLYNEYGLPVGATLPAPILEREFIYKNDFVQNTNGQPYSSSDFDLRTTSGAAGEINHPKPVGEQPGTLGWYYSTANNLELRTPVTDYPYGRSHTPEGPDPTVSTSAGIGNHHRMGSGREVTSERQKIAPGDLTHYLALRSHFVSSSLSVSGHKIINTDPDAKKLVSFVDADGRALASAMLNGSALENWSYAYYNDLGQLVATVAPNGVNTQSTAYPAFVTLYKYDHLGRLIETTSPDEGTSRFVYSTDGKIRFSESQLQREAVPKRFSYTNYDYMGRLVESGEYTSTTGGYIFQPHSTTTNPPSNSILNIIDNVGFTGVSKKNAAEAARCADYTFIYYDREVLMGITSPPTSFQKNLDGQVARTENDNATTLYSYDEFGQLTKTWQQIKFANPAVSKTVDYTYDYFGNVVEVAYQSGQADAFHHYYEYDINQRLTKVSTRKGTSGNPVTRAAYEYFLHGPLKRIVLYDGSTKIQGIDYTYNIDGSLKAINHADPAKDPGNDGNDIFGETLLYFDGDYQGAGYNPGTQTTPGYTNRYSGLIKAWSWHSPSGNQSRHTYAYEYDNRNQLVNADFGSMTGAYPSYGLSIDSNEGYREAISGYDKNGNIQSLLRKGKLGNALANFQYHYVAGTNRLDKVTEGATTPINYNYNTIGQMTEQVDGNKTFRITYNVHGMVSEIRDGSNQLVQKYLYDDRGDLLQKVTYTGGTSQYVTYINDASGNVLAIYHSTTPAIQTTPLEIPLYGSGRFAVYKPVADTYFYEISDHLGNVRGVIGSVTTEVVSANFESAANQYFVNYSRHQDDLMDHTDGGTSYTYSQLLNGGYNGRIGLARSMDVSPGDVIKVEAYAKYRNLTSSNVNLSGFATALTGAFGLSSGMGGEAGLAYDALGSYGAVIAAGYNDHHEDPAAPKAFINILIFDKNFNFVDGAFDQISGNAEQLNDPAKDPHDYLVREVTVEEPGYAFIFLSNENLTQVDVHFDDVKVSHTHSPVVAGADYYPFGLVMEGREIEDEPYRWGYQGQFSEKDLTTGMQEFELRMYDPRVGRWLSPDPYGQYASPYVGMGNIPQTNIDPDGGFSFGGCPPICPSASGYWIQEIVVEASRIPWGALPELALTIGTNLAGGPIFLGADDGIYSLVPAITGSRYYQAIDNEWRMIYDVGLAREQYARDLLTVHQTLADINATLIMTPLSGVSVGVRGRVAPVAAKGGTTVYTSVSKGVTQYVGITKNFARRSAEHLASKGINIQPLMRGLSRTDARAVEQALIEIHGLGKNGGTLLNRINSISPKNPAYGSQLQRGYDLLKSIGY